MKINELEIKITKAVITQISITLEDKGPKYDVTGELVSDKGVSISRFYYSSKTWPSEENLEIPVPIHSLATDLFKTMTPVIYKKINGLHLELKEGKKKE